MTVFILLTGSNAFFHHDLNTCTVLHLVYLNGQPPRTAVYVDACNFCRNCTRPGKPLAAAESNQDPQCV